MTLNIGALLQAAAQVAVDVEVDAAELAAGQVVEVPFEPQIGTSSGKPVYLQLTLAESKQSSNPSPVATAAT